MRLLICAIGRLKQGPERASKFDNIGACEFGFCDTADVVFAENMGGYSHWTTMVAAIREAAQGLRFARSTLDVGS